MSMNKSVCIQGFVSTCFHIHTYIHVCECIFVYAYLYMHMFVFVHALVYMFVSRSLGMYLCVYVFFYIYICLCVCIFVTHMPVYVSRSLVCKCASVYGGELVGVVSCVCPGLPNSRCQA